MKRFKTIRAGEIKMLGKLIFFFIGAGVGFFAAALCAAASKADLIWENEHLREFLRETRRPRNKPKHRKRAVSPAVSH